MHPFLDDLAVTWEKLPAGDPLKMFLLEFGGKAAATPAGPEQYTKKTKRGSAPGMMTMTDVTGDYPEEVAQIESVLISRMTAFLSARGYTVTAP
jgi:hypothetical protein